MEIIKADITDIVRLELIFNMYRAFYGQEADKDAAIGFLEQRIAKNESVILYAQQDAEIVGFTQVFSTFSSASLTKVFILNDLFVLESSRNRGIATLLIEEVLALGKAEGCSRVSLSTAQDNPAQKLYEELGFRESAFKFYNFAL